MKIQQTSYKIIVIKLLQIIQFCAAGLATFFTPVDQCIYGFFAFGIGCIYALLHLMISQYPEDNPENSEGKETNIMLSVIESIHNYIPLGFINMELHRLSSQYSILSFVFCIPFGLDILSRLFADDNNQNVDEKVLLSLNKFNIIIHSISIGSLARRELNIWFMCVWLATVIVCAGIFLDASSNNFYVAKCVKLIGYIFLYVFSLIGIYDDDFMSRLEWFNIHAMDYQ